MERRKILIATKTYPSISRKYRETVCTAGILLDSGERPVSWIRIYPIRYRSLESDNRYSRWSVIEASIEKNDKDSRLESYRIEDDSIEVIRKIGTHHNWQERKSFVLPFQVRSMLEIQKRGQSLGIIKPKVIEKYFSRKTSREWSPSQQMVQDQLDLFDKSEPIDKIPYQFGYQFIDQDDISHKFTISDWEISQLYRNCRDTSIQKDLIDKEKEAIKKVRQKLEDDFMQNKDLYFIVGNLKNHRKTFMIIGIFYPPLLKFSQLSLFTT